MNKNNDYGLSNKPRKNQIYQSGKMKGNIKYGLLSRVCEAQLECIKDHKESIDHLLEVTEFLLKQNQDIWNTWQLTVQCSCSLMDQRRLS